MPQFICPNCRQILRVRDQDLGRQGRCNKCGQRIALIGRPGATPLMAAVVENMTAAPAAAHFPHSQARPQHDAEQLPPTEKQTAWLRQRGVGEEQLARMTRRDASRMIEKMGDAAPPTQKQLDYLTRLGAQPQQLLALRNRKQAAALIEEMHLKPTAAQLMLLRKLGAPGERIARLKSKGEASALIDELKK